MGNRARLTQGRLGALASRVLAAVDRRAFPHTDSPDEHWLRIAMNRAIAKHLDSLDPASRTAVEISGTAHAGRPWKAYDTLAYPEFDLCAPLAEQKRYDVVICEQVLEHVVDPWTAVANLRGLCEPGVTSSSRPRSWSESTSSPSMRCGTTGASPPGGSGCCSRGAASRSRRWAPGGTGRPSWGTSTAGRPTGRGIRSETSGTFPCRCGGSPTIPHILTGSHSERRR